MRALVLTILMLQPAADATRDLPRAVREAIRRVAGTHAVEEVERSVRGRRTVYEAEFDVDGREHEVTVDESGTVVEVREEVDPEALPDALRAVVARAAPGRVIREVEAVHLGGAGPVSYYDVEVRGGRRLAVEPDGRLRRRDEDGGER